MINKSSGPIFKKIVELVFLKIYNYEAIEFIREMAEEMIEKRIKVSRAGELLEKLSGKDIQISIKIMKIIFDNEIEL